jgi:aliphatic sulfonates family ABC transporter substrate-binding protein
MNRPVRRFSIMRRGTVLVVIGMTFILSMGSGLAAPQTSAETPLPLKIGYQSSSADNWLLFTARDLKFFETVGVAPEYIPFDAGPPMVEAAKSNIIDVALVKTIPFMSGLSQGVDWVMIGIYSEGAYSESLVTRKDSGIDTPAELRGKRIGYYKGASSHYGLVMIMRQYGIRRDEVNLVHMLPEEQLAAFKKNDIDAAMVWEPWIQRMVHEANGKVIATEGDLGIYTNVSTISVRREWLRDNRETAVRFLRTLIMAYHVLQKDHSVAVHAEAKELAIDQDWVEEMYRDAPPPQIHMWTDPRYLYSLVKGARFHRRLEYLAKFLFAEKVFPKELEVHDVLDASVVTEALNASERAR